MGSKEKVIPIRRGEKAEAGVVCGNLGIHPAGIYGLSQHSRFKIYLQLWLS